MSADLDLICQCCNREPAVGVASIPGVPMSIAWCQACIRAEVVPVWVCEFWRDMADGQRNALAPWAHELINSTLAYFAIIDIVNPHADLDNWWAAWQPMEEPT